MRLLFDSLFKVLVELAREGVFIKEICTNAYTPSGLALCKEFGFTFVGDHRDHGKIFARKFFPFPQHPLLVNYPELGQLYAAATEKSL